MENRILRDLTFLDPELRNHPYGHRMIERMGKLLPTVVSGEEVRMLVNEWRIYSVDENLPVFESGGRIDNFWISVGKIEDGRKYPNLSRVAQACLVISHGNASVERGFSVNSNIFSQDRPTLGHETLAAQRLVRSEMDSSRLKCFNYPVTPALRRKARDARKEYFAQLEENRVCAQKRSVQVEEKRKEEEIRAKVLKEYSKEREGIEKERAALNKQAKDVQRKMGLAHKLMKDAMSMQEAVVDEQAALMNKEKVASETVAKKAVKEAFKQQKDASAKWRSFYAALGNKGSGR